MARVARARDEKAPELVVRDPTFARVRILGVGVLPPAVSWGNMIASTRSDLQTLPYELFEPILCIFFTVLSLNYLGDIVRARTDVRESTL